MQIEIAGGAPSPLSWKKEGPGQPPCPPFCASHLPLGIAKRVMKPHEPSLYAEQPHERPGFLLLASSPVPLSSRQALTQRPHALQRPHVLLALDRHGRAAAHRRLALLRRALAALRLAVSAASRQRQKWTFLRFAACFAAWKAAAQQRRRLERLATDAAALRRHTLVARALAALHRHATWQRAKRRSWGQAESFHLFCTLVHVLDGWRRAVRRKAARRQAVAAAVLHWAARLARRVLAARRAHVQRRCLRQQRRQLADAYAARSTLSLALGAWAAHARLMEQLRDVAAVTIERALYGSRHQLAAMCLRGWRLRARRKAQQRDDLHLAARLACIRPLSTAVQGWRLRRAWQAHLRRLAATLHALQPRLLLACALHRWQAAVHAAQVDDSSLCHRALQLPRAFAGWRQHVQRQASLRQLGERWRQALERRRRRALLAAWRLWATGKLAARGWQEQAAAHWLRRAKQTALTAWHQAALECTACRQRQAAAAAHWGGHLARAAFACWRRRATLRRLVGRVRELFLLGLAFAAWRQQAARKTAEVARWRLAVRQHYLRQLWAGLAAWQQHHGRQQQQQRHLQAMRRHRDAVLVRSCLVAWRGPFLAAMRLRRSRLQLAGAHCRIQCLRQALAAWCGPFLAKARHRRLRQSSADAWRAVVLLRRAWRAWQAWHSRQASKRQHLAVAATLLRPGRLRRLLAAWCSEVESAALHRRQATSAQVAARWHLLRAAFTAWCLRAQQRRQGRGRWCAAVLLSMRLRQRRVLRAWRAAALHPLPSCSLPAAEDPAGPGIANAPQPSPSTETAAVLSQLRQLQQLAAVAEHAAPPLWAASIGNLPQPARGSGKRGATDCR